MGRKTYWISKPEQLRALKSPLRHDIGDRLTALGPMSVRSLAEALGCKPTAIYRHLRILERVGLVVAVETSGTRGRPAGIYRSVAPVVRAARAPLEPRNRRAMASMVKAMAAHAAREYADAFNGDEWRIEGPQRNHWFLRLHAAPSRQRLARINALLDELAQLIWTPDPNPGPPLHITWIVSPAGPAKRRRPSQAKATARTSEIARRA